MLHGEKLRIVGGKRQQVTRNWQQYRKVWFVEVKCKKRRRILVQLRDGTAALEVETGRWQGFRREERVCRNCKSEELENMEHWLLSCNGRGGEREVVNDNEGEGGVAEYEG